MASLHELARLYGVLTSYYDVAGNEKHASPDALMAILRSLGAPLSNPDQAYEVYRGHRQALLRRVLQPVAVIWQHENAPPAEVEIRLAGAQAGTAACRLALADGEERSWQTDRSALAFYCYEEWEGVHYVA
jgi:hypothetical protein